MALLSYNGVGISGIAVCVPGNQVINKDFGRQLFDEELLQKTIQTTGIERRPVASEQICTSDLCFEAAQKLLSEKQVDREEIDVLIFVSQTPDFRIPATACLLQHRLGLSRKTAAFDLNMGCSGYVYGLSVAHSYAIMPGISKVLLLVGDTVTKFASVKDKSSAILFGDAGSATLLEKMDNVNSWFSLNTDGSEFDILYIKSGGYRYPGSPRSFEDKVLDDGSIRNDEQLVMNGGEIFNFTIREVPGDIRRLIDFAGFQMESIDYFVLHQANKFILDFLVKKIKCPPENVVFSLQDFGNTSSASIPVTLASRLRNEISANSGKTILVSGFGVGLSWGSAILQMTNCLIPDIIEI